MGLLMDVFESTRIAMGAVAANRGRSALTTIGIVIGILAVTMTLAAFNGMQAQFLQAAGSVGADVVYVSQRPWINFNDGFRFRNRPNISLDEAEALADAFRGRALVNPSMSTMAPMRYKSDVARDIPVIGTTEKMPTLSGRATENGRFIMAFDVRGKRNVAVIGKGLADSMFGDIDPINKMINLGSHTFRVIGVMEEQGGNTLGGPDFDRQVFVPISTFVKAWGGRRFANVDIAVKAPSIAELNDFEYEVIGEMRRIRKLRPAEEDNFSINKLDSLMGAFNSIFGVVLAIGLSVTSISLIVGGVGVMNIMFVSVTERTREIGIRKSIGAKRRSLLMQFLIESAAICLIGGAIGVGMSVLLVIAVNSTGMFTAALSPGIMALAVALSIAVGIVAGIVPAWKAAKLDPVVALRYE